MSATAPAIRRSDTLCVAQGPGLFTSRTPFQSGRLSFGLCRRGFRFDLRPPSRGCSWPVPLSLWLYLLFRRRCLGSDPSCSVSYVFSSVLSRPLCQSPPALAIRHPILGREGYFQGAALAQ